MEIERRTFIASAAAVAATAVTARASAAVALASGGLADVKVDPWNQPAGLAARWETGASFLRQDDESRQDFTRGIRVFTDSDTVRPDKQAHQAAFLKSKGYNPLDDVDLTNEEAYKILAQDPVYAARVRMARTAFAMHWDNPRRAFYKDSDFYLGEMEKTDNAGPGRLELDPSLDIPDWARHEIHSMPGGYVGDPFAGWVYHVGHVKGTDALKDRGRAVSYGQSATLPADRKVKRILDMGCSMGDGTMGLKLRFPEAEVWGIDVGGPLLRYAHYQSVQAGFDINYSQRNAESTGFPDNHFDMVGDIILFHEVSPEGRQKIVKEIFRILRPGGVFHHVDAMTAGHPDYSATQTISGLAASYVDHRHNVETWMPGYKASDFPGLMRAVGFEVDFSGKPTGNHKTSPSVYKSVTGIKPMTA